jgi:hypothetical protein
MPPIDSRYATVALTPASSSYGSVPVSNFRPVGDAADGRALYGRHVSASSARTYAIPRCGPQNLYGEQSSTSQPSALTSIGSCAA